MTAPMTREELRTVATAICKSLTCEGVSCCQWPAQGGRTQCPVRDGAYDHAARDAIAAMPGVAQDVPSPEPVAKPEHRWTIEDRENAARNERLQREREQARAAVAAPQPSPRLEREAIAKAIHARRYHLDLKDTASMFAWYAENPQGTDRSRLAIYSAFQDADAILALLSPDTTVVSSTLRGGK
jgi:hypothetical protein